MTDLTAHPLADTALAGQITIPGDKSISHRSLMLGAVAIGTTRISGLLEGQDVLATADAMRALGADITRNGPGDWTVKGVGIGGLQSPEGVLDFGNAGTGSRLVMGLVAGHEITATFTGDASLSHRPMDRILKPVSACGASYTAREGKFLPVTITGPRDALPLEYTSPVASAQIKSAVLLAGLNARGNTIVSEPKPSRDHTENMLRRMGAEISSKRDSHGRNVVTLTGQPVLKAIDIQVPGDPSSAAFSLVAALITEGSAVTLTNVGMNPLRAGLIDVLDSMGAAIIASNRRDQGGERVADLLVQGGPLKGAIAPPENAAAMIDEYPILAVAAALAEGQTELRGIEELRIKESDRISVVVNGLRAAGIEVEEFDDGMIVHGTGGRPPKGGCTIDAENDHRIGMSFLVLGLACQQPITITGADTIATSYPGFVADMTALGARIEEG